jgi:hypothetical protein
VDTVGVVLRIAAAAVGSRVHAIVAAVAVRVTADVRIRRIGVRAVRDAVVVVIGVAAIAHAVGVTVRSVVGDIAAAMVGSGEGAVVTAIAVAVATGEWVLRSGVGAIRDTVAIVIGIHEITDAVGVTVGSVCQGVTAALIGAGQRAIVASISVRIPAHVGVVAIQIYPVGHAIVVEIGLS